MPVVLFLARLDLEQICLFLDEHLLESITVKSYQISAGEYYSGVIGKGQSGFRSLTLGVEYCGG